VRDLAERVVKMTGTRSAIIFPPLPIDDPRRRRPDISIACRLSDWMPSALLECGVEKTIASFAAEAVATLRL
jgi:UDP-glucuronate decarboxylase